MENNIDFNGQEIEDITNQVVAKMKALDPKCHFTVQILLWDDGTKCIRCRSMTRIGIEEGKELIRDYEWYKGEIKYKEELKKAVYGIS